MEALRRPVGVNHLGIGTKCSLPHVEGGSGGQGHGRKSTGKGLTMGLQQFVSSEQTTKDFWCTASGGL